MLNRSADVDAGPSFFSLSEPSVPGQPGWCIGWISGGCANPPPRQANTWVDLDSWGISLWGTQSSSVSSVLFELCLDFLIGPLAISRCNVLLTPKRTDGPWPMVYWKDEVRWEHPGEVWLWKMCYICIQTTVFFTFADSKRPCQPSFRVHEYVWDLKTELFCTKDGKRQVVNIHVQVH